MKIRKELHFGVIAGVISLIVLELYLRQGSITRFTGTFETTHSTAIGHTRNVTQKVLPHCIIAGVAKCGTRALLEYLKLHTHVSTAPHEVQFFNKDPNYRKGLNWYKTKMNSSYPHQLTLEKTPLYFANEKAPGRIHHMNSSIKLIFTVREPVTRMISHYVQLGTEMTPQRREKRRSFEEEVIGSKTGRVKSSTLLANSLYDVHFKRWLKHFSRAQIHIVDGDAFVKNPLPELEKIEDFLGIEHQLNEDMFYYNETRGFYCRKNQKQYSGCMNPEKKGLPHPNVAHKVIAKLCKYFEPHNKAFYKLVGHHYHWECPKGVYRQ